MTIDEALDRGLSFTVEDGVVRALPERLHVPRCKTCGGTVAAVNDATPAECECEPLVVHAGTPMQKRIEWDEEDS